MFALLPGSRLSEIEMHASLVLETAARAHEARDDARSWCRSSRAPRATRSRRRCIAPATTRLPITLLYGHAEDALRAADVGIVASGTATLEAALARCPHVIFYRVSRIDRVASSGASSCCRTSDCPTCLPVDFVVPEFLQNEATPRNLAQAALNLFDDTVTRRRLEALFAGFAAQLSADTGDARRRRRSRASCAQAGVAC